MWVRSLGWGDPLEEEMATHPSIRAWRILWTKEPGRSQSMGSPRARHDWSNWAHAVKIVALLFRPLGQLTSTYSFEFSVKNPSFLENFSWSSLSQLDLDAFFWTPSATSPPGLSPSLWHIVFYCTLWFGWQTFQPPLHSQMVSPYIHVLPGEGNCWKNHYKCTECSKNTQLWATHVSTGTVPMSLLLPQCLVIYTAAAAKSLQSCLTLCDPRDSSPPGSPVPGILQARTLEWVAISFSYAWKWKNKVKSLSRVRLPVTPWTAAHQASPSMGFARQEYWSGLPLPSPVYTSTSINVY